jgi:hypothetical protein
MNFFNLSNPSGAGIYSASNIMSIRSRKIMFWGSTARAMRETDNLTAIREPIVYTMWDR